MRLPGQNCSVWPSFALITCSWLCLPGSSPRPLRSTKGCLASLMFRSPVTLPARGGCWFEDGDLKVHLGVDAGFRPATKGRTRFHCRRCAVALAAAVVAAGFAVNDDEPLEGLDRVYVTDPFGNRIELMQPTA